MAFPSASIAACSANDDSKPEVAKAALYWDHDCVSKSALSAVSGSPTSVGGPQLLIIGVRSFAAPRSKAEAFCSMRVLSKLAPTAF
jgi:hypothetical protein